MEGYIDKLKLLFLYKLLTAPPSSIHKQLFVKRLFSYIQRLTEMPLGFVPDIINLLHKYELYYVLQDFIDSGHIPPHHVWKKTIKDKIHEYQTECWRCNISQISDLRHFSFVHYNLKPLDLWQVAKRNPYFIGSITNSVNILCGNIPSILADAFLDNGSFYTCTLCNRRICLTL